MLYISNVMNKKKNSIQNPGTDKKNPAQFELSDWSNCLLTITNSKVAKEIQTEFCGIL